MQWIVDNWVLLLLGGGFLAMHLFGHGHGHGRKGKGHAPEDPARHDAAAPQEDESGRDRNV